MVTISHVFIYFMIVNNKYCIIFLFVDEYFVVILWYHMISDV